MSQIKKSPLVFKKYLRYLKNILIYIIFLMFNKKNLVIVSLVSSINILWVSITQAICPVCVLGVTSGLGLARWLKIDDTITGLWIGGVTVAVLLWTIDWFKKKNIHFTGIELLTTVIFYVLIFWPLRSLETIGNQYHTIWGIDKLILTISLGSIIFFVFEKWYRSMRAKRGKSLFRYQKVVWPLIPLTLLSIFFYFVTKYNLLCCYQ